MEIERNPKTPELSPRAIELLTELCFRKNDKPEKVDGIFVFSSTINVQEIIEILKNLLNQKVSSRVFLTGGRPPQFNLVGMNGFVVEMILSKLDQSQFPEVSFSTENRSTNTLECVTETLTNPKFIQCQSILFISNNYSAGRCYLSLRKFFPDVKILQTTFSPQHYTLSSSSLSYNIDRDDWFNSETATKRVWEEYLKIKDYGIKGDIEYNEVKDLVTKIEQETF